MKLYQFDGVDAELQLIPLAARRALDAVGKKLKLQAFLSLPWEKRAALVRAGSENTVDETRVEEVLAHAHPAPTTLPIAPDPAMTELPSCVETALGPERPLPQKVWQALRPLDRYALAKVCSKNKPERIEGAYREIVGASALSTHLRPGGGVHMVSVSDKAPSRREARAECWLTLSNEAFERLLSAEGPKGDVLATARIAGIMATKQTSQLIPLCHPLSLEHAEIDFSTDVATSRLRVVCQVVVFSKTGVEMEAMVGANLAALTVYDMLKSIDRAMIVGPCRLLHKSGGRSGSFDVEETRTSPSPKEGPRS